VMLKKLFSTPHYNCNNRTLNLNDFPMFLFQKKVDPFVSTIHLPHSFKSDINKIVVTALQNPDQARIAMENGAAVAGGAELVEKILADEITADFYLAEPDMVQKLLPLKNKLRKKFPKSKRGSVGMNIPKMLALFKSGHEYMVEDIYVNTQVATVSHIELLCVTDMSISNKVREDRVVSAYFHICTPSHLVNIICFF
uniref:39S ribosomal protein L1, mitochondrial-like n=1 Tax=Sinocyclocheilus grahami TaxID=75366 RepID=A0A672R076_SINGR